MGRSSVKGDTKVENDWIVTGATPGLEISGLQRYWIGSDGLLAMGRLVDPTTSRDSKAGYCALALSDGTILRGRYISADGNIYLGDNDGRLGSGWVVSGFFTDGLQRYWIDVDKHYATVGFFSVAGSDYYGIPTVGYVLRGAGSDSGGTRLYADNDGRLASGWLVTDAYGQGLQRYWCVKGAPVSSAYITAAEAGWDAYATSAGYVLRGAGSDSGGTRLYANNDGVLASGWLVTDAYGQGLQRYWCVKGAPVSSRLVDAGDGWWAYATADSYVVRGAYVTADGTVYVADNDGRLAGDDAGGTGAWVVSDSYGQSLQRYWIESHAARTGFFSVAGEDYYGIPSVGYVLRGAMDVDGKAVTADNGGVISKSFSSSVSANGTASALRSTEVGTTAYLFVPSYGSLSATTLTFSSVTGTSPQTLFFSANSDGSGRQAVSTGSTIGSFVASSLLDGVKSIDLLYSVASNSSMHRLVVMLSSDIRTVYVVSLDPDQDRAYVEASADHTAKASVTILVVDPDGSVVYNQDTVNKASTIKGRGNSTWGAGDKKPYQVKLAKKCDLLGTGDSDNKQKTWLLLANANDATLLHNSVIYDLALELGLTEGTQSAPCDLYYDGEYRGNYLLCEKVEINPGRVDITDLEGEYEKLNPNIDSLPTASATNGSGYEFHYVTGLTDPADISGGYLLELDNAYYSSEKCWFKTSVGTFVVKSPECCSEAAMRYISEQVQAMLDVLSANDANLSGHLDVDSFAKSYLVNEFTKNIDGFDSSTYFYKDSGSDIIHCSPVWDGDGSLGTRTDWYDDLFTCYEGLFQGVYYPWCIDNDQVMAAAKGIYQTAFSPLVHDIVLGGEDAVGTNGYLHSLAYYREQIRDSQAMDQVIWGLTSFSNTFTPFSTYQANYDYLVNWLGWRVQWFDGQVATWDGSPLSNAETVQDGFDWSLVYDYDYYVAHNPDVVAALGTDPVAVLNHFVTFGMSEGRQGSLNFNVGDYAASYADLRSAFGADLMSYYRHYVTNGFWEGRDALAA